jgi:hypothetical protein
VIESPKTRMTSLPFASSPRNSVGTTEHETMLGSTGLRFGEPALPGSGRHPVDLSESL